jgi:cytochrome c biogenesis protein
MAMVASSPSAVLPSRLAPRRDVVEWVWEKASSLTPTIPILIGVSLACVLGTFANPDNASFNEVAAALEKQQGTFMGLLWHTGIYSFLELNDLFHSWWFLLMLVALALNLTACTIDRLPRIYNIALHPQRRLDEQVVRGLRHVLKQPFAGDVNAEAARLSAAFRVRGFEPRLEKGEDGAVYLFAERGRFARFGVYVVHAALLCILAGGIAGRIWGYEGTINVFQDGGVFDFVFLKTGAGAQYKHALPVPVRVRDFRHFTYKDGTDKSFESDLEVLGPGGQVVNRATISVGHPMKWAGWTFYQASYQVAPERALAKLFLTDTQTGARQELRLKGADTFQAGQGVSFRLLDYRESFADQGPAVRLQRVGPEGESDFWVFQNAPDFDRDNRADRYALQFAGIQPMYFTGLQVARDPGAAVVFGGCILMFVGLFVAFYTSHRRLWARVRPGEIWVAGAAHKNHTTFAETFESLRAAVQGDAAPAGMELTAPPG